MKGPPAYVAAGLTLLLLVAAGWLLYRRFAHGERPIEVMKATREEVPAWLVAGYGLMPLLVWLVAASLNTSLPQGTYWQALGFLSLFWSYLAATVVLPVIWAGHWLVPVESPGGRTPRRLLYGGVVTCIVVVSMTVLVLAMGEMLAAS